MNQLESPTRPLPNPHLKKMVLAIRHCNAVIVSNEPITWDHVRYASDVLDKLSAPTAERIVKYFENANR